MNRTVYKTAGWGSFVTTLGAGWILWRQLVVSPANPLSTGGINVNAAPAPGVSALPENPIPAGVPDFEAQAVLAQLRETFSRDGKRWYPNLKTWMLLGTLSQPQVDVLLQSALTVSNAAEKQALVEVLFEHLATVNPDYALVWVDRLPPESTGPTVAKMLSFWGTRDVAAARQWYAASLAARSSAFPEVVKVFKELAMFKPPPPTGPAGMAAAMAAYHEARSKAEPGHWSSREAEPVGAWARETGQWSMAVAAAGDDSSLRSFLHSEWAASNPVEWLAWMRDHPQEGRKEGEGGNRSSMGRCNILGQAISGIMRDTNGQGPSYAVGPYLDGLLALLTDAGEDFTSEHGSAKSSLKSTFPYWLKSQPTQASAWVKRRQKEPWIEPIIAVLSTSAAKDDPVAAMAWAGQIKDAKLRQQTYLESHAAWRIHDPAAADAWAADHPVELGQ